MRSRRSRARCRGRLRTSSAPGSASPTSSRAGCWASLSASARSNRRPRPPHTWSPSPRGRRGSRPHRSWTRAARPELEQKGLATDALALPLLQHRSRPHSQSPPAMREDHATPLRSSPSRRAPDARVLRRRRDDRSMHARGASHPAPIGAHGCAIGEEQGARVPRIEPRLRVRAGIGDDAAGVAVLSRDRLHSDRLVRVMRCSFREALTRRGSRHDSCAGWLR